jgi:bacterioferritin (cytochrome b1)
MRPSTKSARGNADRREIVDELNRLMAEEAEACLRYFHMRFRLRESDYRVAEEFFQNAIAETLEHATSIGAHIRALGHIPTLRIDLSLAGGPMRLETALAEALEVEQQALDAYRDFLPRVTGDPGLEQFISKQVTVETEHVDEIRQFVRSKSLVKVVGGAPEDSSPTG